MNDYIDNWKAQLRKGYLEMCILLLIHERKRLYGLEIMEALLELNLSTKEGTLYPILNRMTAENLLSSSWEVGGAHPRKYYVLNPNALQVIEKMTEDYNFLNEVYHKIRSTRHE